MTVRKNKAPFPWPGGKSDAAPLVWAALGDVEHYVDPFCGSLAVPLLRPHPCNRTYYSETVNDANGFLANALRSLRTYPVETAQAASIQVCEADLHAVHLWLLKWGADKDNLDRLCGTLDWCDPVVGGRWLWGMSTWIGSGFCSGEGPWILSPDGRMVKREGPGVGVSRKRPHLVGDGVGVNHAGTREPGVSRQLPHLGNDGMGVNHAGTREPGVSRQRPHLVGNGMGVNRPQLREPGVADDAMEFHPMTMPELLLWFEFLSARLRHVRILNGDWTRAIGSGASKTLTVRQGGICGVFLDPPYGHEAGRASLYGVEEDFDVAADVRKWCVENGDDPMYRIVLAGYDVEHVELEAHGWRVVEWFKSGFLKGGYANQGEDGNQQHRERLWLSPHCLDPEQQEQGKLF